LQKDFFFEKKVLQQLNLKLNLKISHQKSMSGCDFLRQKAYFSSFADTTSLKFSHYQYILY